MKRNNKRLYYSIAFFILLITEILIALYVHDNFIRPYIGDVLVVTVVYCFVRIFIPDGVKLLPLYVFVFATSVEVLQYFQLIKILNLESSTILRIIIGSTFDIKDIICYCVGSIIVVLLERILYKRNLYNLWNLFCLPF